MITEAPEGSVVFNPYGKEWLLVLEGDFAGWLCERHDEGHWVTVREMEADDYEDFAGVCEQFADSEYENGAPEAAGQWSLKADKIRQAAPKEDSITPVPTGPVFNPPKPKPRSAEDKLSALEYSFMSGFEEMQVEVHATAKDKGWWDEWERNKGEQIALMHSELSEALEALREGNPPDDNIPNFSGLEAEFADVIIRIMDTAERYDLDVAGALIEKARYNKGRERKHGGKEF